MIKSDGWKLFSEWLDKREKEFITDLKKADNFRDVLKNQAFLNLLDRQKSFTKNSIDDMYNEMKKENG